jgi:diaminopimelate epimerase
MTSPSPIIPFVKAQACGNDFLIVDGAHAPADLAEFSRRICDRHQGIGADGVEWLFPAQDADIHARLFNADGSEAEISGNGTRCVAAYVCSEQAKEKIVVRTGAGVKTCVLTARNERQYEFETAMGEPLVGTQFSIRVAFGEVCGIPVSMGNPHYAVFVKEFSSGWQAEAAEIARHSGFTQGINVELVKINDKQNVEVRFFERGVGETQSSGTGSCSAAVAAISAGKAESPVRVHAVGGVQTIRWDGQVFLRGPAQLVGRGEFFL